MESEETQKEDCFEIEIPFNAFQYLSTDNCNIHSLCRVCLSERNQELYPLISAANSGLQEMFTGITAIQVYPNDGLPSHICNICRANVISCYEFKTQCLKSDCALKSLLNGEFVTKEELSTTPLDTRPEQPINVNGVPNDFDDIKSEETHYLEDLTGSDSEALCTIQSTENDNTESLEVPETDFLLVQQNDITNKTKEKKHKADICSFCLKRFRNTKAVKSHMTRIHGPALHPFSCSQCKESFETEHDLNLHRPVHKPGPSWTCAQCNKGFKGRSMFRRHIQRHMECKRYACASCGKPFTELYALRRHARVHTGEKLEKRHACHLCDKRYSQSGLLEAHIARHGDVRPCICTICGKAFPSTRHLLSHQRVHLDDKPHPCGYCEKRFRHESTLRTHERTHTGERPYVCATCGKRFIQNSNLTLHMRTHTGDRPYACETCGRCFSSGSSLKTHIRTHTGEKPYECPECGKRFARMDMSVHMRLHSGERPHSCSVCARRFLTAARLRAHCRVHTGEKPFECEQCSQKFGSKSHLVKHVKTHQIKKKRPIYIPTNRPTDQPTCIHNEITDNKSIDNLENVQIVASEDVMDADKEIVIEAVRGDGDGNGGILIPDRVSETQAGIPTGTLCVASGVNTRAGCPTDVNLASASALGNSVQLYQVDQSLVQIRSSTGQLTISKITSKMTTNF